jgi:hypothetical protein
LGVVFLLEDFLDCAHLDLLWINPDEQNVYQYSHFHDWLFSSQSGDDSNPDLYVDIGFKILGFVSLHHTPINPIPATAMTHSFNFTSGSNKAREDSRQYVILKLNEFIPDGENAVSVDDDFLTLNDHLPESELLQTESSFF